MEIATSSCQIETKFKCKLNLNIQKIKMFHRFALKFNNGMKFAGMILFDHIGNDFTNLCVIMDHKVFEVEDCIASCEIIINGDKKVKKDSIKGETFIYHDNHANEPPAYGIGIKLNGKLETCNGWIELEFKPCAQIVKKQQLKTLMYNDTFGSNAKSLDFRVLCQGKSFKFNKSKLCFLSDVFQKMIETPYTQESKSETVEIEDFSPEVIEAFDRVVFQNNEHLDEKDLTTDLLLFANKYCILSLVKVVANHLGNNLTMDNIYPVIKAAYLMVNDELLKDASKFIRNNPGKFEDNEDWQQLEKSHPQCYIKLMKFIMFQK